MNKKFIIKTLGCRVNQYESQAYSDQLESLGYEMAKKEEDPDICLVNTCSVTNEADKSSTYQIRKLIKKHPKSTIVVTGCYVQNEKAHRELEKGLDKEAEIISLFEGKENMGPAFGCDKKNRTKKFDTFSLSDLHKSEGKIILFPNKRKEKLIDLFSPKKTPPFLINSFFGHTRAFVKVQDGCDLYCSYCIVPYMRGSSRSRKIESVIDEVKGLVENGYKEVVLAGINLGEFGKDLTSEDSFYKLLERLNGISGLKRIRLSSINPDSLDDSLIDIITGSDKIANSMHISLQSGSDEVLKRMRRRYTSLEYLSLLEKIIKKDPDFTFTTDVIVGFPGESDIDFEKTIQLVEKAKFMKVHLFPYSKRPGTLAAKFAEKVELEEVIRRKKKLEAIAEPIANERKREFLRREMQVLLEKSSLKKKAYFGHTKNFLPVYIPRQEKKDKHAANTLVRVRLDAVDSDGVIGSFLCDNDNEK